MNAPAFTAAPGQHSTDETYDEPRETPPAYDELIDANERLAFQIGTASGRVAAFKDALSRVLDAKNLPDAKRIARDALFGVQL